MKKLVPIMRGISLLIALLAIAAEVYLISEYGLPKSIKDLGAVFIAIGFGGHFLFAGREERKEADPAATDQRP